MWGKRWVSFLLLLGTLPVSGLAAGKKILGFVKDRYTNNLINHARITAASDATNGVYTDDTGCFNLPLLDSAGPVIRLRIEASGYKPADLELAVTNDKVYPISLTPNDMPAVAQGKRKLDSAAGYFAPESFVSALRADAKTAFESMKARYDVGVESFFSLVVAHDEVIKVELLVAQTKEQKVTVYQAALDEASKLEAGVQTRYSAGVDSKNSVYLARLHRSEVELMLAKEKSGSR
jgi:hypothetical protein